LRTQANNRRYKLCRASHFRSSHAWYTPPSQFHFINVAGPG